MGDLTTERLASISRTLNDVKSVGQARAAGNAALKEITAGRALAGKLPGGVIEFVGGLIGETVGSFTEANVKRELGACDDEVRRYMGELPSVALNAKNVDRKTWDKLRPAITRVYVTNAGTAAALGELATWNPANELGRAIGAAPGVLVNEYIPKTVKAAGSAIGTNLEAVGEGLGDATGGLGKGLAKLLGGAWWIVPLVVIAAILYFGFQVKMAKAIGVSK